MSISMLSAKSRLTLLCLIIGLLPKLDAEHDDLGVSENWQLLVSFLCSKIISWLPKLLDVVEQMSLSSMLAFRCFSLMMMSTMQIFSRDSSVFQIQT